MDLHEIIQFVLKQGLPELRRKIKKPRIHSVLSEIGPDSSGEPAIWLWVVLDDPPDSEMTEEHRNKIRQALVDLLRSGQFMIMTPVYFFFQTKSDRAKAGFPT